jgi:hypothetical protein
LGESKDPPLYLREGAEVVDVGAGNVLRRGCVGAI